MIDENTKDQIVCENLLKIYKTTEIEVVALQGLDLTIKKGEVMAIIGNSGSGKSTLLNIIGGLDKPSAGKISVDGTDLLKLEGKSLMEYKRDKVGFVWQNNARNLIPYLSAVENVEIPMMLAGKRRRDRANELLDMVGLTSRRKSRLAQLSGGEQQRVAIAIAMANIPTLLLADEPTGSVDTTTTKKILDLFKELNRLMGVTVIIVTHDRLISRQVDRVVAIRDGRTSSEFVRKKSYLEELDELKGSRIDNGSDKEEEETHEELAVIDKAGRIQVPREYLDSLSLKGNKIKVEKEEGRIVLIPPED